MSWIKWPWAKRKKQPVQPPAPVNGEAVDTLFNRYYWLVAKACGVGYKGRTLKPDTHLTQEEQRELSGFTQLAKTGIAAGVEQGIVKVGVKKNG